MTTHALARHLLAGPDVLVTTNGYEGGYHEVDHLDAPAPLRLDVHRQKYYGPHEYSPGSGRTTTAVNIR